MDLLRNGNRISVEPTAFTRSDLTITSSCMLHITFIYPSQDYTWPSDESMKSTLKKNIFSTNSVGLKFLSVLLKRIPKQLLRYISIHLKTIRGQSLRILYYIACEQDDRLTWSEARILICKLMSQSRKAIES